MFINTIGRKNKKRCPGKHEHFWGNAQTTIGRSESYNKRTRVEGRTTREEEQSEIQALISWIWELVYWPNAG